MILRKPYAFLIKFFKIIHIIMFIFFCVFIFLIRNIYTFNIDLVNTNSYYYIDNMAGEYVPFLWFIMVIILLIGSIFIYSLMKNKNKPVMFYRVLIIYCAVLFIYLTYFRIFFTTHDGSALNPLYVVIMRDITAFVYYINFFFVAFSFARGFGFDIKKFSFDQDKKALDIEETDNEEFELNIALDKEKILARLHKEKREFKYYVKDNLWAVILFLGIISLFIGIRFYSKVIVPNQFYNEKDDIKLNNFVYKINNSVITSYNKYSLVASKENDYLIVSIDLTNNSDLDNSFGNKHFRINNKGEYLYPETDLSSSFSDLGVNYKNTLIKVGSTKTFTIIFKIAKNYSGRMYFEIFDYSNGGSYKRVLLKPITYEPKEQKYNMNEDFIINDINLKIIDYHLSKMASYEYLECKKDQPDDCNKFYKMVYPSLNEKVLTLDILNAMELGLEFFDDTLWLRTIDTEYDSKNLKIIDLKDNKLFISVPKSFNGDKFDVIIKKRNAIYDISLKGGQNEG